MNTIDLCDQIIESVKEEKCLKYHTGFVWDLKLLVVNNSLFYDALSEWNENRQDEPKYLLSSCDDGLLKVYNLQTKAEVKVDIPEELRSSSKSPRSPLYIFPFKYLIACNMSGKIIVFQMKEDEANQQIVFSIHQKLNEELEQKMTPSQIIPNPNNPEKECFISLSSSDTMKGIVRVKFDGEKFTHELVYSYRNGINAICPSRLYNDILYFGAGNYDGRDTSLKKLNVKTNHIESLNLEKENDARIFQIKRMKSNKPNTELLVVRNENRRLFFLENEKLIKIFKDIEICRIANIFSGYLFATQYITYDMLVMNCSAENFKFSSKRIPKVHSKWMTKISVFKNKIYSCAMDRLVKIYHISKSNLILGNNYSAHEREDLKERVEYLISLFDVINDEEKEENSSYEILNKETFVEIGFSDNKEMKFHIPISFLY